MQSMIPFNRPQLAGNELSYIEDAVKRGQLSGDGYYSRLCEAWMEQHLGVAKALMTHSCTAALEMAAILADLEAGDEVIMPSFTFVSTANAFVLRRAVPVFVDIDPISLCIDPQEIEKAISERTKAICVVHYAGVACDMDPIMAIAEKHGLIVIEDAAQAMLSEYKGKKLGTIGHLAALSFHETKNIISGEGGALLINDKRLVERAEIIREKGTNRKQFFRGFVDKYTWVDIGSSFLPSEIICAFLYAQLEKSTDITLKRLDIWQNYDREIRDHQLVAKPDIPDYCKHNAHMYHLRFAGLEQRDAFIQHMKSRNVLCVFHYIPLHDSPAGTRFGLSIGDLRITRRISDGLVRLPLWTGIDQSVPSIAEHINEFLLSMPSSSDAGKPLGSAESLGK